MSGSILDDIMAGEGVQPSAPPPDLAPPIKTKNAATRSDLLLPEMPSDEEMTAALTKLKVIPAGTIFVDKVSRSLAISRYENIPLEGQWSGRHGKSAVKIWNTGKWQTTHVFEFDHVATIDEIAAAGIRDNPIVGPQGSTEIKNCTFAAWVVRNKSDLDRTIETLNQSSGGEHLTQRQK